MRIGKTVRLTALLMALCLSLSLLAACGQQEDTPAVSPAEPEIGRAHV